MNLITSTWLNLLWTVFYNTLKHNRIILYHIWYLLHDEPTVLYIFQNTPSIVSACCIKFNYYKMRIYSITVFFNTLKHSIPPVLISTCCIEFTLLLYSTTLSSIITSFCIIFDICNMINYRFTYIPEYSQYWFQHAVLNLITKSNEFTLLQYSTTLSSIITSFCIIFDICNMINYRFAYIPVYF